MTLAGEYLAFAQPTTITTMSKQAAAAPGRAFCSSTPHVGIGHGAAWGAEGCRGMSRDVMGYRGMSSGESATEDVGG